MRRSFPVVASIAAIATVAGVVAFLLLRHPPVHVLVEGRHVEVPRATTFGALIRTQDLHATNGRLLSVDGTVLDRRLDPGRILLDGTAAPHAQALLANDAVTVVDGQDRTEGTERVSQKLPAPQPLDPMTSLSLAPMEQITIQGKVSGTVVRQWTKQIGPLETPKAVALTFDDGPWPETTQQILKVLRRYHVPATFFVVGYLAARYPMLIRAEAVAGMHVENHSMHHITDPPFADLSPNKQRSEIVGVNNVLQSQGLHPTAFRPPGGSWDDDLRTLATGLGMHLVLWSIDTRDFIAARTPKEITKSVLSEVRPGSIVLMHDGGGDGAHTAKALPAIIKGIRKKGLGFEMIQ